MISGVILAAGTSSRIGRPKQLLEVNGRPLLQHAIDVFDAVSLIAETVVVLGPDRDAIEPALSLPPTARVVINEDPAAGQSRSLAGGLAAMSAACEAAVVLLGDQPHIDPGSVDKVIEIWRQDKPLALRAVYGGTPGHPVLLDRRLWGKAMTLSGDVGARALLADVAEDVLEIELGSPRPIDVDTWADYEALINSDEKSGTSTTRELG